MKDKFILILIIILAVFLRFNNINWDSNFHLHPDERFLTMVGNAMTTPLSFKDYLDPNVSSFNPVNIGHKFYVYGVFPLTLNKIVAVWLGNDNYNAFTIQGRFLSAVFDILTLLFVYKIVELFENKRFPRITNNGFARTTKYWSAFFYAIAVLPIQLSHFFAVDTFLSFFMVASFYFALKSSQKNYSGFTFYVLLLLSAIFFGLAAACKVTAVFILPLNFVVLFFGLINQKKSWSFCVTCFMLYVTCFYLVIRFADPYYFQTTNFFDPTPNKLFVENLKSLKSFEGKDIWYPPGVQWINKKPIIFSLVNLAVFGVGMPYFVLIIIGFLSLINSKVKSQKPACHRLWLGQLAGRSKLQLKSQNRIFKNVTCYMLHVTCLWVIAFFLYQSTRFAQTMRYYIFIYPFLAIVAAVGATWIISNFKFQISKPQNATGYMLHAILIFIVLIWPLMFSSIYLKKHTRVEASEWIYKNLPNNSVILGEYWDDSLPLAVLSAPAKQFIVEQLHVFDPDIDAKWKEMNNILNKADYYVLSSNRGWGSITTVPEKYPMMSKFYNDLLSGKTNYKLIKEFTSYPSLCYMLHVTCYMLNDQWADESFTVYDHPKVMIFKNVFSKQKEI